MSSYVVSYDLNRPGQEYEDLIDAIKSYGTWWGGLASTWVIKTDDSAKEIRDHLKLYIDSNDELFVGQLTGVAAWTGLTDDATKWLKKNL
jgi:hypothetical protein